MIKSQDELTTAGSRQSDVLIEALKKCQELEAENKALKEKVVLLKECRNLINECISGDYMKELCERIDEVLK